MCAKNWLNGIGRPPCILMRSIAGRTSRSFRKTNWSLSTRLGCGVMKSQTSNYRMIFQLMKMANASFTALKSFYAGRSEEHTSELHHVAISYAVFCLKKKNKDKH